MTCGGTPRRRDRILAHKKQLLRRLEQQSIDTRFQVCGSQPPAAASKVVLVQIDESTFDYLRDHQPPARWPFPRRDHARVIDQLRPAGAKVTDFDLESGGESGDGGPQDGGSA